MESLSRQKGGGGKGDEAIYASLGAEGAAVLCGPNLKSASGTIGVSWNRLVEALVIGLEITSETLSI